MNPYEVESTKVTFNEIYNQWSETAYKELSTSSVKGYKSAYKYTTPLHDVPFVDLKAKHLQDVVNDIDASTMCKMTKFLFQKMYKYAMENDIVEKDYSKFVKLTKTEKTKEKLPFSQEEINTMWSMVDEVAYADLVIILLYTGMRIGELLEMKKSDIHLEERYMVGGNKTESGKDRIIPIHKKIIPLLEKRMSGSEDLFTNKRGKKLTYALFMAKYWGELVTHLENKDHSPHSTRHTFISRLDNLGVNRVVIQRIVGHSNKSVTDIYTHKNLDDLLEAVDLLD